MGEHEQTTPVLAPAASVAVAPAPMSIPALMVAGGLSGFTSRFATHPFDTIKTRMQVQHEP
jgi:hypothetical protein